MTKNDIKINALLEKVEEQKAKLGPKPKATLVTNGVLAVRGMTFNLNVCSIDQLVVALANLLRTEQEESFLLDAADILGVKKVENTIGGYSIPDWKEDIKTRVAVLQWNEKKRELEKTETALNQMISEDAKTSKALADIEKMFE